ncbi:MAG: filamentous hemagglutinin, partial [Nostoc sp.]
GTVGVTSQGSGNGGSLKITANTIRLDRQGSIQAQTESGNGGNINLQVGKLLLLRHNSAIAATAGGNGNGGNININAPIIAGLENSDIIANAFNGNGGNINITTQGIFGLKYRDRLTRESDITASSQFGVSGTVQVNTIGIDPNSGLVELPANVTDPSQQIATGCAGSEGSSFVA